MNRQQIARLNYRLVIIEGFFLFAAFSFLGTNSVVPVFIQDYTGSVQLAGLASSLRIASMVAGQMLVGPYVAKIRDIPRFNRRLFFLARPAPILMVAILSGNFAPSAVVWMFLILFAISFLSDGIATVPSLDLIGRTIEDRARGRMFGFYQLTGGIGGLASGFVIKTVLDQQSLARSDRYMILFGLSGILFYVAALIYVPVRDLPRNEQPDHPNFLQYFAAMPRYFKAGKAYQRVIAVRITGGFSVMVFPFIILFAREHFNLAAGQVSTMIYLEIAGSLAGGLIWGSIAHRFGNKWVVVASQATTLLLLLLIIVSLRVTSSSVPLAVVYSLPLITGINVGSWMGYLNYTIDIAGEQNRPVYLVMSSVITFPLAFLSFFAGILASRVGYPALFAAGGLAAALSFLLSLRLYTPAKAPPENTAA